MIAVWIYGKNYIPKRERWYRDIDKNNEHKIRWSYSRTTSFENCKYGYYLNYIIKDDEQYPNESNYYSEVGSYVHGILEKIFKGELKKEDALKYYLDNYKKSISHKTNRSIMDKTHMILADYFANLDLNWVKNYDILGVELKMEFKIDDYDFIGFIDLLLRDKRDGKIVILDHKSTDYPFKADGGIKKKVEHSFDKYKKQMYLYAYAVKQIYNEFPKEMTWNHFKNGGKLATIPFIQSEYENTIEWVRDVLTKIENEEDFEPNENYFYCTNLCNFRRSCEYHKKSMRQIWKKK